MVPPQIYSEPHEPVCWLDPRDEPALRGRTPSHFASWRSLPLVLVAHYRGIVNWERFTVDTSIAVLSMLIIGGLGRVSGSIYGAIFVTVLPALLTQFGLLFRDILPDVNRVIPYVQQGAFGIAIIFFLIKEPEGIAKMWKDVKDYFKLWPFSY